MMFHKGILGFSFLAGLLTAACGGDSVDSAASARLAYEGLDLSIDKAIDLGLKGYSEASSANIPDESTTGDKSGTLTVIGKVDQGSSANKTMSLGLAMVGYSDSGKITYDTAPVDAGTTGLPALDMQLKDLPSGTVDGTLTGTFHMSGDLTGDVTLALAFSGTLMQGDAGANQILRQPGTTHITGTAQSPNGTYQVDVTR